MQQSDLEKVIAVAVPAGGLGLVTGVVSGVIKQRYGSWQNWVKGLIGAVSVAVLVGLGIHDTSLGITTQAFIIGVCAFVSSDLIESVYQLATVARSDPVGFLQKVRDALRGGGGGQ